MLEKRTPAKGSNPGAQVWRGREEPSTLALQQLLRQLDRLRGEIAQGEWQARELAAAALRATSRITPVRYSGMARHSRVESAVLHSVDVEKDLEELRQALEALLSQVRPLVEALPAGIRKTIAHMRFLDGKGCAAIGLGLHYSRSFVYKALSEAMTAMVELTSVGGVDRIKPYYGGLCPRGGWRHGPEG